MKGKFVVWMRKRIQEPSTWMGLAMVVILAASDPLKFEGLTEAVSLIIGGGLVMTGAGRRFVLHAKRREEEKPDENETVEERRP